MVGERLRAAGHENYRPFINGEFPTSFPGLHILTSARVAALTAHGQAIAAATGSALTTAVTLAAQAGNPIGAAALKVVSSLESTTLGRC